MKAPSRLFLFVAEAIQRGGWPAITLFTFHVIASQGFHAYELYPLLDVPMHFFGGVAIAYFLHRASLAASTHAIIGAHHQITHNLLVFAWTGVATVFWEFAEFICDQYFGTRAQLGVPDTLGDMLLGIFGGITLQLVCFRSTKSSSS